MTPVSLPATTWRSVRSALAYQRDRLLRKAARSASGATAEYDANRAGRLNEAIIVIDATLVIKGDLDPRDPADRPGIFRDHNCWRCKNGTDLSKCPTPERPGNCGNPQARNC